MADASPATADHGRPNAMELSAGGGALVQCRDGPSPLLEVLPRYRSIPLDRLATLLLYLGLNVVGICAFLFWTDACIGRGNKPSTYRQLIAQPAFWWPTISHTGASFPARPIFQAGLQWMGSLLLLVLWAVHSALYCRILRAGTSEPTGRLPLWFNRVAFALGIVYSMMMVPTGAISLEEYEGAHNLCAAGTFLFAILHSSFFTFGHLSPPVWRVLVSSPRDRQALRERLLIYGLILLPGFIAGVVTNMASKHNPDCQVHHGRGGWCGATNWMAVAEYYEVFGLGMFLRSFRHELSGHYLAVSKPPEDIA